MKTHTSQFKENISKLGRELDSKITYTISGTTTELGDEQLNSVMPHYEGAILKSVMKQLDVDSNVEIPVGTEINYQFGVKVNGNYEYIDYGNYIVKDVEKQEDTHSYKITCYDKMLYAMKDYENSNITFPLTIRDYIDAICTKIGLTFANSSDTFANYNKTLNNEVYLDSEGRTLNYTFRDVLDELAQVTASTICINENDQLEIRYINQTVGKNLFDINYELKKQYLANGNETSARYALNGDTITMTYDLNTYGRTFFNKLTLPAGTYTLQYVASLSGANKSIRASARNYDTLSDVFVEPFYITDGNRNTHTFTLSAQTTIGISIVPSNASGGTLSLIKIQLEKSNQATAYEPYGDTIDEEYLKDINVNFGEKYGPVNTIVLSRGGDGDKISLSQPTNLPDADKIAIQISDNQIMNSNDRNTYMSDILTKLYGLEYYINDFTSTGICYYDLCDRYNIKVGNNFYSCIMFNDSVEITQGLQESIYTDMLEETKQEYKYMNSTDRGITQANIIANKVDGMITEFTQRLSEDENKLNSVETRQTDTERTINVMSTNIDSNGNITEVTTTTGFTFNADGMTINRSGSSFYAVHDDTGTYYYDGGLNPSDIVGQYTKDGSKQKDLQLFGVYYYGMNEYNDTPMFVAQLYTDENSEEGFGHFYNRGD